jgi:septal ring factor EnvC (AmiA/AmiB activator)
MKWLVGPVVAAVVFAASAFASALEDTTRGSARLARSSAEAPRQTRSAAQEVDSLPAIEQLTARQAGTFEELSDALEVSADRAASLNDSVAGQLSSLEALRHILGQSASSLECVGRRLERMNSAAGKTPAALDAASGSLNRVLLAQTKSLRHLRSINHKLAALGAVAAVSGTKPPAPPPPAEAPSVTAKVPRIPCR